MAFGYGKDLSVEIANLVAEQIGRISMGLQGGRVALGGTSGSEGGSGVPPGGFVGQLIQTKVAYDTTEASSGSTPSAPSLLDNLNHIRYWIDQLTSGSGGGPSDTIDGISNLGGDIDFIAGANMTITPDDEANTITFASSGSGGTSGSAPVPGGLVLTARGGAPRTTNGCAEPSKQQIGTTNLLDMYVLAFDKDADEFAQWAEIIMPEDWDGGTITARFAWTSGSGVGGSGQTVCWGLRGRSWGDDEAIDQALGTGQFVTDTWLADRDIHISAETATITLAGTPTAGETVLFEVQRDVSEDTLAGDAWLIAIFISYTRSGGVAAHGSSHYAAGSDPLDGLLTAAQKTDLTDGGQTTLHAHTVSGTSVEVQEDDVKVADATIVNFEGGGGKVTDEGGGKVTVDITPGAGGGASYDPDTPPTAPSAYDDEFDDDAVDVKWTFFASAGVPTLNDAFDHLIAVAVPEYSEAKFKGFMALKPYNAAAGTIGVRESFIPVAGTAFTAVAKIALAGRDLNDLVRLILSNEQPTGANTQTNDSILICMDNQATPDQVRINSWVLNNGVVSDNIVTVNSPYNGFVYLAIWRMANNSLWTGYSMNGIVWQSMCKNVTGKDINTNINYLWFLVYDSTSNNPPPIGLIDFVRVIEGAATDKIGKDM